MNEYRKIILPHCPYCDREVDFNSYNYDRVVGLVTGHGSSDVVVTCDSCKQQFRITASIRLYGKKLKDD